MPPFLDDDSACTSGSAAVSRVDVTDDPDPVAKAGASSSTGEAASQPAIFNSAEDVVEDPTMSFQLPFCKFQKIYEGDGWVGGGSSLSSFSEVNMHEPVKTKKEKKEQKNYMVHIYTVSLIDLLGKQLD